MYSVHLKDFTTLNEFTLFSIYLTLVMLIAFATMRWDERRHRRFVQRSNESARQSMERLKKW